MNRFLSIWLLGAGFWLLIGSPAHAQRRSVRAADALLTRPDTAAAVHELFASRRTGGGLFTAFGGVFTGLLTASIAQVPDPGSGDKIGAAASIGVMGLMPLGVGIGKLTRYSKKREQQVLTEYAQGGRLAHKYRRRLRGNFRPVHGNQSWPELAAVQAGVSIDQPTRPDSAVQQQGAATPAPATATSPVLAVAGRTRADTLDAVLGLFMAKRFGGQLPALLLVPVGGLIAGTSNADGEYNVYTGQYEEKQVSGGAVAAGLGLALGSAVYMFVHNAPYSMAKFQELEAAYNAGQPLPPALRAQLKPKHFDSGREWRNKMARRARR
ncbi:hypothetical protein F0P96_11050 [Hymenobacter busanensis]|uniref:Uncharacterized protein n=1 Tax=Hymenobacter busanensis TaxID=2607656 RepID=A0A7L4ZWN6_9BACT|nr:hypothetical protein [Hymenobacter busanensis]KAA9332022.1 hypothetical protein F0P96_11050 [Hymenobacter busanensis]QHJ07641.1 hypothetical protein GUY19_10225 [Hymenobacter busanensis]